MFGSGPAADMRQKGADGAVYRLCVHFSNIIRFEYKFKSVIHPIYWLLGGRKIDPGRSLDLRNALLWAADFVLYRLLLPYDTPVGITLPVMLLVGVLSIVVRFPGKKV